MCGIAGFVGRGDWSDLVAMTTAIIHRGPDDDGHYSDPTTATYLGFRRLAIVDIGGGAQPMWNEDGQVGVVYNGEIYNHLELRAELERLGHVFRTDHSDTEVLVHGYEEWGEDLPSRLNGMFAFAIYDRTRRRLFLARDRFGEKPLYIYHRPGLFAFASELTALVCHRQIPTSIEPRAVQKLFAWGFIPAPNAFYRDCRKPPGGSALVYDIDRDEMRERRYWRFTLEPDASLTDAAAPALAEELRGLISQAVERRLMSDVPLGMFFSGGIDSGAILAAGCQLLPPGQISAFTIGFTEPSYDESPYARTLASELGVRYFEEILDLDAARDLLPGVLRRLDEPLGDASILPTYLLSRFARRQVTVALSGDGGDELFAGYDPFKALTPARIYAQLMPRSLHRGLRKLAELLPRSNRNMSFDFKVRRSLSGLSWPPQYWNPVWLSPADPQTIAEICDEPLSAEELYSEALDVWNASSGSLIDKTLEFYTNFYLPDDVLTKVDRATMMVSLESRAVLLDNDLVDFCRRLPSAFKYRNGVRKWLLKEALKPWLPERTLTRPKKGFGIPLVKWLPHFTGSEGPELPAHGINAVAMGRRWDRHLGGRSDDRLLLFAWLAVAYHAEQAGVAAAAPAAA
jgi:asparagine synthase (glutamine-hydrolysing)